MSENDWNDDYTSDEIWSTNVVSGSKCSGTSARARPGSIAGHEAISVVVV